MTASSQSRYQDRSLLLLGVFGLVSLAVHGALLGYLALRPPRPPVAVQRPVELVMVDVEVEVETVEEPPPPPPEPEQPKPPPPRKKAPPPIKVAVAEKPPPPETDEPPPPPPPNDAAPQPAAVKPVPLVVGISMSSTTTAGSFSAPVGNTLHGKTATEAADPAEVKTYSAPKYQPIHMVDSAPSVVSEFKIPYPDDAKRAGIEGQVILAITVDHQGAVVKANVISGPGYGLDAAALEAIRRFRFRPAMKGGEPVSTQMRYTYTFYLD